MNLYKILFISLFTLSFPFYARGAEDIFAPRMPFKTIAVFYDITGSENGTEILYMRNNGVESARIRKSTSKMFFQTIKTDTIDIMTADHMIQIDMVKRKAKKLTNPRIFMKEEYEKLNGKDKKIVKNNAKKMGISGMNMLKSMGGEFKEKAGEHLGYTCDTFSFMGIKMYQMSGTGVMLKTQSNMMGMNSTQAATKVNKNGSIPNEAFDIPKGITPVYDKQADDMNRQMAKRMIDMLKDPEGAEKMDKSMKETGQNTRKERRRQREQAGQEEQDDDGPGKDRNRDRDDRRRKRRQNVEDVFKGIFN